MQNAAELRALRLRFFTQTQLQVYNPWQNGRIFPPEKTCRARFDALTDVCMRKCHKKR